MSRPLNPLTRFYVCPEYSVDYRRTRRLSWNNQTNANFALLVCLAGSLDYEATSAKGRLSNGELLILEPNVSILVRAAQVEVLLLNLSASTVIPHAITMRLIPPQSTVTFSSEPITVSASLNSLLRNLTNELVTNDAGREIIMQALVQQIVVRLLRSHARVHRSPDLELSRVGIIDRRIRRSVELMHAQPDQDLTLKDLARASYLSPFHFARLFKKLTGVTPHNYLAQIRIEQAKHLLGDANLSITEVGSRVGYLSASHFSQAFRMATGTTPREFRKGLVGYRS